MDTELKKSFIWEIDNIFERRDVMTSDPFSSGGCEWRVRFYPKGYLGRDDMCMYLHVANIKSLRPGWKRIASFSFALLNQSGKELYKSLGEEKGDLFCIEAPAWGVSSKLTLSKLQEEGSIEKKKLIIHVYTKIFEVVHQGKSTANEPFQYKGFQIVSSQVDSVDKILEQQPDFAVDVIPKNSEVKAAYMKLLLSLINTLNKSPQSLYVTDLSNAQNELTELTQAGFKLDWLKLKLEEISLERKKALSDGSWVQQLEERVKNVELTLSDLKDKLSDQKDNEMIKSVAVPKLSSFEFLDFLIKRFFLSCFSISKP